MTVRTDQTAPGRAIGLDVSGVSKMFGSFVALKDVDLKVPAASFHAMLGENGAGKTTLVRCITGYYHPDHGKIAVDGHAVTIASPRDAHRFGIGMVHQSFTLVPSLTGAENLVIARADRPVVFHWDSELKRMNEFLERMPFRAPLDVPVWTLSAGEKQKLQILKQLYLDQRFLISGRANLRPHSRRGGRVAGPASRHDTRGRAHDMPDHAQIARSARLRRRSDRLEAGRSRRSRADSRSDECGHRKVDGRGYSTPVALDQPQTCAAGGSPCLRNPRLGRG